MKKTRICKCGSGKELQKGKQKCDVCNPKKKGKGGTPPPPAAGPLKGALVGSVITLDLSKRPELAMKIAQLAEENYRTLDMQVLYMLHQVEA